ncbi:FAD-dependent oxidoreductase [Paenibacillus alvei]|uniref:FAD-dependent oxidoreductase n=1 Tax=Paenibacillus alvei TaxID=44250 RepID=A0ABT4H447_PAEAL|nr:DsrE/DsrF/DrsH-like family protein [Paenibacillus alvei]EJW18926.1 coenzyme A disulfide reductase Cdr [Paenibacillus alvei DSM 29]MCY9539283.1 FAD-dependent oxidoreductase [Paenibacillus alvei]MCY9706042.1 FAD-dependent oxidoreductase [Paenibacillus alvei]MCY9736752.1 FAD-dependent oxidoreductase [Paenibacillus alvei]MCY9755547.1 FAD-dependent oxidoreductase [Paenibacillus alvei]
MSKKVLIVGGVAGGASAAARLRRLDEDAHIVIFERDAYVSFANCGLPYYIGDTIQDRNKLFVQTPEAMHRRFNIDVRVHSEVIGIDTQAKKVRVRSKEKGEYEESYDSLILSPGAKPVRPPLPGIESKRIYTLRNIPDTDRVKTRVMEDGTRSAVVIGGGFIGVEMAENLREIGLDVTLVEAGPAILAPFDAEMAGILSKEMEQHGTSLIVNDRVQSFRDTNGGIETQLASGKVLASDMVILAIGVAPDTGFIRDSGIELGPRGHIIVNDHLQTNVEDVYAVGDAVEVVDFVNGTKTAIPLAGPANKQGRIAADNVSGLGTSYKGSQGTSILKVFGLTGAATGNNEKTLQRLELPYKVTYVHPNSHAGYYPGAKPMTIKLIFNEEGIVLGSQIVGYDGVDKRMDVIATVIRLGGTVTDLTELELSYAPPYSSAKDPVNMAGYTAENIRTGAVDVFTPADLEQRNPHTTMLVDVRTDMEHQNGHIPDSLSIPVDELRGRLHELDREKEIWVYCQVGLRGYTASRILSQHGFKVKNLTGGYKTYQHTQYTPGQITPPARPDQDTAVSPVKESNEQKDTQYSFDRTLDACGLCCPGPLMQVKQQMDVMQEGQVLKVNASDPGFYEDIQAWAGMSKQELLHVQKHTDGTIEAHIRKLPPTSSAKEPQLADTRSVSSDRSTMIVFSGDLDKAIASFIIANGAAASGKKVTLFFTFWGLNILRKPDKIPVNKSFIGRMFGAMMPRGSQKLGLSKMNMMGIGPKMIRSVMNNNNVSSLEELIESAIQQGVEIVACQMSMDVMGIAHEELIDGVIIGGVGYYLGKADQSGINLFI